MGLQLKAEHIVNTSQAEALERAAMLEDRGDYEGARRELAQFWQRVGEWPGLEDCEPSLKGEVLLRVASLTRWLGSAYVTNSTEIAKNLATQSIIFFNNPVQPRRLAEAYTLLGAIYGREGSYDEGRVSIQAALNYVADTECDEKASACIVGSQIEIRAGRPKDALDYLDRVKGYVESTSSNLLKGLRHMNRGVAFKNLGLIDESLIEHAGASYYFQEQGHLQNYARAENNLGFTFLLADKPLEAHRHLNTARQLFHRLKEKSSVAQVDETRACVYLHEGRNAEAVRAARAAEKILEGSGESTFLVELMTTHGIALARLGNRGQAYDKLRRAVELAETVGDVKVASRASLAILEELFDSLSFKEMCALYKKADEMLRRSQDQGGAQKLRTIVLRILDVALAEKKDGVNFREGFSIEDAMFIFEEECITKALKAGGGVTGAARLLGISHQNLSNKLKSRFQHLRPNGSKRRSSQKNIPQGQLIRMPDLFEICRPLGVDPSDELIAIDLEYDAFIGSDIHAQDMLVVKVSPAKDGEPVALKVWGAEKITPKGAEYVVGYLRTEPGYVYLETNNPEYKLTCYRAESVELEGVIVGYCKSEDVAKSEKGDNGMLKVYPMPQRN